MIKHGLWISLIALTACKHQEPNYCEDVPDHNCLDRDAGSDGSNGCTMDTQCSGATAVCDTGLMTCVQCTPGHAAACVGTMPVCGTDDTCHACSSHDQCSSDVCLPDGSCSDGSNVAYVSSDGTDNTSCTKALPCTKVAKALATLKPYLKLHGTSDEQVSINNQNVSVLADPGAKLTSTSNGIVLEVKGTSQVSVYDLEITGASGASGYGVSLPTGNTATVNLKRVRVTACQAAGVSAIGGILAVNQSTISGNAGGGVTLSGTQFAMENNFIVENGGPSSLAGGIDIQSVAASGTHQIDFNTIASNAGAATVNSGINCGTVTSAITFGSNIIYGNSVSGGGKQIGGSANCLTTYSDIGPDTATGTGNLGADPAFVNLVQHNYHIMSSSPCKDAALPAATLDVDFDGEHRPQGAGREIGADEVAP